MSSVTDESSQIESARQNRLVWCRNGMFVPWATPCANIRCPHKKEERREATSAELADCGTFQITEPADHWEDAKLVYPKPCAH